MSAHLFHKCRPNFEGHVYTGGNKFPAQVQKTEIVKGLAEMKQVKDIIPLYGFLYSKAFTNYCMNPFDAGNKKAFIDHFRVPIMTDDDEETDEMIGPPFLVSYLSMARDASLGKEVQRVTPEMVNKWLVMPLLLHVLYAAQNNKQLDKVAVDPDLHEIVFYTLRHHVHQFGMQNCKGQPCMHPVYDIPFTHVITSGTNNLIGATIMIAETINVSLMGIDERDDATVDSRRKAVLKEADTLATMYDTQSKFSNYPKLPQALEALGEVLTSCFVSVRIATNTLTDFDLFCPKECCTMQIVILLPLVSRHVRRATRKGLTRTC